MAAAPTAVLRHIRHLVAMERTVELPDRELLQRFCSAREQAAFEALVRRHGPLVLGVCRRVLGNLHDADDAFQATFLALAQKAQAVRSTTSLAGWLYRVAYRAALRAKALAASRRAHEAQVRKETAADPLAEVSARELLAVVDEEVQRLAERYRVPLVLCYLEGKPRDEAAQELRCSLATLKRRLDRARERLRARLARRGLALPGALLVTGLAQGAEAVPARLVDAAVTEALRAAAGEAATGAAAALAEGALSGLSATRLRGAGLTVLLAGVLTFVGVVLGTASPPAPAVPAAHDQRAVKPPAVDGKKEVVVTGRVLDPDGKPVKGAQVGVLAAPEDWAKADADNAERMAVLSLVGTGGDGAYTVRLPAPTGKEPYPTMLLACAKGYGAGFITAHDDKGNGERVIRLTRQQVLRGRFIDLQGAPVKGVTVHVVYVMEKFGERPFGVTAPRKPSPVWWGPLVSDEQGRFRIEGVGTEHHVGIQVRDERFNPEVLRLWETAEQRGKEVAHALVPAQMVQGRITYADSGKPVAGARLRLQGHHHRADGDGHYRLNPFLQWGGPALLFALPPAGEPYLGVVKSVEKPKAPVREQSLDFALPRGVLVRGSVTEAGSTKPLAGAAVYFIPQQTNNPNFNARDSLTFGPVFAVSSGADGKFAIAVLPGPGHLLVKGPTADYVPLEVGMAKLWYDKPGGRRHYAHGLLRTDFKPGSGPHDVALSVRRGVTVKGMLVGPDGEAVSGVKSLTRLNTSGATAFEEIRGSTVPASGFAFGGCDKKPYPVVFFQEDKQWGAVVNVSAAQEGEPLTVRLERCGSATVRFLDKEGKPLEGHWPEVEMVFAPGPHQYDVKAQERGELSGDTVLLANIHRRNYQLDRARTDAEGRITLPALVPGVTYRIIALQLGGRVLREFRVRAGEALDLKDVKLAP